jgi:hypothetical protein
MKIGWLWDATDGTIIPTVTAVGEAIMAIFMFHTGVE